MSQGEAAATGDALEVVAAIDYPIAASISHSPAQSQFPDGARTNTKEMHTHVHTNTKEMHTHARTNTKEMKVADRPAVSGMMGVFVAHVRGFATKETGDHKHST